MKSEEKQNIVWYFITLGLTGLVIILQIKIFNIWPTLTGAMILFIAISFYIKQK